MRLKKGVKLKGLSPQMAIAALVVYHCFKQLWPSYTSVITSANDGSHMIGSLHGDGNALDFRTKDFSGDKHALVATVREALGEEFDVVLEKEGTPDEHMHVEYDPD